jgi:hypothetical protein
MDHWTLECSTEISSAGMEWKTTKASAFWDAQKVFILKLGADGVPVVEICRRAGIRRCWPSIDLSRQGHAGLRVGCGEHGTAKLEQYVIPRVKKLVFRDWPLQVD